MHAAYLMSDSMEKLSNSPTNYDSTFSPPAESAEKNRAQCFISYSNLGISDDEMTKSLTESSKVTFSFLILVS